MAEDQNVWNQLKKQRFDVGIAEQLYLSEYALSFMRLLEIPTIIVTTPMPTASIHYYFLDLLYRLQAKNIPRNLYNYKIDVKILFFLPDIRGTEIGDHLHREERKKRIWQDYMDFLSAYLIGRIQSVLHI